MSLSTTARLPGSDAALAGMSVIVTGAGSGIGRGIAECVATAGGQVVAVGRSPEPLSALRDEIGSQIHPVAVDITVGGSAEYVVAQAVESFGEVSAVVNNAGWARFAPLEEAGLDEFEAMLRTNVTAPAALIRAALPHLRAANGSVVNISSVGGVLTMPGRSFYGASKAALNSLTRSLALELAPQVRVNAILPGPVDTPMWSHAGLSEDDLARLRVDIGAATPMGRFGRVEEIGRWVCCLLDPQLSSWITGALIPVDGGRTA
ncbi:SDR family oxidoreductase [Nocardia sp. NPDC005998]|uniref:SDR family NAD(P)-dependent oxidoreductase n=1 Tax=Nocardia sp. NPDC005998 TaxID=3156894 RepID=UPI0033A07413